MPSAKLKRPSRAATPSMNARPGSSEAFSRELNQAVPPEKSLELVLPELEALPDGDLLHINLDPSAVAGKVIAVVARSQEFRPELEKLYDFDLGTFDKLRHYAAALLLTDTWYEVASKPEDLRALLEEAKALREVLRSELSCLAGRGLVDKAVLKRMTRMHGAKNVAQNLSASAGLLTKLWASIEGKTFVTQQELNRAAVLAAQLLMGWGKHRAGMDNEALRNAGELRQRAYTRCVQAYDELRRGIAYLRWKRRDADDIAPSLFTVRKKRRKKVLSAKASDDGCSESEQPVPNIPKEQDPT